MESAILAILSLIESFLPQLATVANAGSLIEKIINVLEQWLPIIVKEGPVVYQSVTGVINALSQDKSTTPEQLDRLNQLQAKADTDFEAAAKDVDPDAS